MYVFFDPAYLGIIIKLFNYLFLAYNVCILTGIPIFIEAEVP